MLARLAVSCSLALLIGCASAPAPVGESGAGESEAGESGDVVEAGRNEAIAAEGTPDSGAAAEPAAEPADQGVAEPAPLLGQPSELPPLTDAEREIGRTFQPLASEFGFTHYVRAARVNGGLGILFEYLPDDENLKDWHYRGTFVLTRVAKTWDEAAVILPRYAQAFAKQMDRVNEAITWPFPEGQVVFIDYELGSDARREHSLATIWQVLPGHLAIFQAQRRPDRFSDWQIEHFRTVAQRLGRADGKATGPPPQSPPPTPPQSPTPPPSQ